MGGGNFKMAKLVIEQSGGFTYSASYCLRRKTLRETPEEIKHSKLVEFYVEYPNNHSALGANRCFRVFQTKPEKETQNPIAEKETLEQARDYVHRMLRDIVSIANWFFSKEPITLEDKLPPLTSHH